MRLYLIRHGQTDWNLQERIQGNRDIPLNDTGKCQAVSLAKGMEHREISCVFTSRLERARQTAQAIGDKKQVPVIAVDGLEEVDFGVWEGLTREEIREHYEEDYTQWLENPQSLTPKGGETRLQVQERSQRAMERILESMKQMGGSCAVVSHGAVLVYVLSYLLRNQKEPHEDLIVENVSITTVEYDLETEVGTLVQCNDTSHIGK